MNRHRILVVDDVKLARMVVSRALEESGFEVTEAETGEEALDLCEQVRFDLVILDYQMPKMSGLAAAEIIRTVYDTPFVFLTAHSDRGVVRKAINHGAQSYLVKPVEAAELRAHVEVALSRSADAKHLSRAVSETRLINVAIGILMVCQDLTREEALQRLRSLCRPRQIKASEAARSIVDTFESSLQANRQFEQAVDGATENDADSGESL